MLLSPDGHALYVTEPELGRVAILNTKTGKAICTANIPGQPSLLALSLDTSVLYVAGEGDSSVRALDPTTCTVQHTFNTNEPVNGLAVAAAVTADATPFTPNQIWIAGSSGLTIFEASGRLAGRVAIAGGAQYISIPGGFTAYVATQQGSIVAVDLSTRKVLRTLLSGGQFGPMDFDENTGEIYAPDRQHNQLDVIAPITAGTTILPKEPARIFHLSSSPQSVAITSDGQLGFVALASGQVVMLDIPGRSIISSIAVGGTPRFIITGLYPPVASSLPPAPQTVAVAAGPANLPLLIVLTVILAGILLSGALWLCWRSYQKRFSNRRS
ncbi:MAG TPA: hypothetical protein VL485_10305 [Ktedonobacteraceae bacterium]|nr:hypothetical protein [Ktedonobacteraceae bacterium]